MKSTLAVLSIAAIVVTGCATSKQIIGPNGKPAYFVKCGSARVDLCYEEAARVCPTGYTFLDQNNNGIGAALPVGNMMMFARGPQSFLVECRPAQ